MGRGRSKTHSHFHWWFFKSHVVTKSDAHFVCMDWQWDNHCWWVQYYTRCEEHAEVMIWLVWLGRSFRRPFRPPIFVPSPALACLRCAVYCKILLSPKPDADGLITVGANEHAGCVEFIPAPISFLLASLLPNDFVRVFLTFLFLFFSNFDRVLHPVRAC